MSLKSSIKTVLTLGKGVASGLPDTAADMDPIELFRHWFHAAEESGRNKGDVGVNPTIRLSGDVRRDVDLALRWREAGATHLSVSTLNRGHLTPADHIEEIEVFKDGWDDAR